MYFLVYHVKPLSGFNNGKSIGGAYVSCWIEAGTEQKARKIAITEIKDLQWEILEIDRCYEVNKENLDTPSQIEFYNQALIDGQVFIFHTYPASPFKRSLAN
jgi:hypothetical protein